MKGLTEINADNAALVKASEERHRASIRRLKQRIANRFIQLEDPRERVVRITDVNAAIDAWAAAERKRSR